MYTENKNIAVFFLILIILALGGYYFLVKKSTITADGGATNAATGIVVTPETESVPTVSKTVTTTKPATAPVNTVKKTSPTVVTNNYLWIGKRALINGVYVTPSKVTYDSRCPRDVKCIQAGTVELGVLLEKGNVKQNIIITLGRPIAFADKTVTLTTVTPSKVSTKTINTTDYRFLITVK